MKIKILILIIVMLVVGGLDNSRELNDLAIVSGIAIDVGENGKYKVTAQILNSKKQGQGSSSGGASSKSSSVIEYRSEAATIQLALRNMIYESPKRLYLGHMELLIISEEIAESKLKSCLDFFVRDNEVNKEFLVVVARGCKSEDIIGIQTPLEQDPIKNIKESIITTSKYEGRTAKTDLASSLGVLLEEGVDLTLPSVIIQGDTKSGDKEENIEQSNTPTKIIISDLAYFKDGYMKGYLKSKDNISYNMVRGKIKSTIVETKDKKNKIAVEIYKLNSNVKPIYKDSKYEVDININCDGIITEFTQKADVTSEEELRKYEDLVGGAIKKNILEYVSNCQNVYCSDIVGYGAVFHKFLNKEYKKIQKDFGTEYFPKIKTNVKVNVNLDKEGGLVNNDKNEYKK
ncbi:MAG: Ger(x)C family spore germination protein [Clostridia bacterium]